MFSATKQVEIKGKCYIASLTPKTALKTNILCLWHSLRITLLAPMAVKTN